MKKKVYEEPEIEIIEMNAEDIICTSGETEPYQEGITSGWY